MEYRRLGRTGHDSSVVTFGGAALSRVGQDAADAAVETALDYGVNHFDVAPSYGQAELRLAAHMPTIRDRIFLACKTEQRNREGAWRQLHESLDRLGVDRFDLYQLHAVCDLDNLDRATAPGGALEAIVAARDQGLVRFIGITGHDFAVLRVQTEALKRFDFDTVMFPLNFKLYADADYRRDYETLMQLAGDRDVGTHILKAVAKAPWGDRPHSHDTWYEPFTDDEHIEAAVAFVLAQPVTTLCAAGDVRVLPQILAAADGWRDVDRQRTAALVAAADQYDHIFPAPP